MDRPAVARAARLLRRARARGDAAGRRRSTSLLVLLALALAVGAARSIRRVVALHLPDRSPCRAGGPVGLDDPRPVGRAAAVHRASSGCWWTPPGPVCAAGRCSRSPLLVLWANLHGSVVLGAALTMLLAGVVLVRRRGAEPLLPALLLVGAPLCVLATPVRLGHRRVLRPDARRRAVRGHPARVAVVEPERRRRPSSGSSRSSHSGCSPLRRCRSRLNLFEVLVVAVTFVGAVQAVRGVIWFALACAAILPAALDGLLTRADPSSRRVNLAISTRQPRRPRRCPPRHARAPGGLVRPGVARRTRRGSSRRDARPGDAPLGH